MVRWIQIAALCLSAPLLAAEVFVAAPDRLMLTLDGEDWDMGDALCVGEGQSRSVCGVVTGRTGRGLQLTLTLAGEGREPRVGDPVIKVDRFSRVAEVLVDGVRANQSPTQPWRRGEAACVISDNQLTQCGVVTEVADWDVEILFNAPSLDAVAKGDLLWRAPGTVRVAWVERTQIGFAQSPQFPWTVGMDFEVRDARRSLARGRVTEIQGDLVVGLLQGGSRDVVPGLWVGSLTPRQTHASRRLASLTLTESFTPDNYAVVGWNTVFPFVRVDWQLSPFVYGGVGLSAHRLGLDGGELSGTGIWFTATYFPRGNRSGPWFQGSLVPGTFTARRAGAGSTNWTVGGAFLGGWQGKISPEVEWGLGGGLQVLGQVGQGPATLNTTGLFPSLSFHIAYGF